MQSFVLTRDHVTLLRNANISWESAEYGAPCIDPKRPYGNSDVELDIAEILGWKLLDKNEYADGDLLSLSQHKLAATIHREIETALQVVLSTGSFEPGKYVADDYRNNWRKA